jgi:hypothetical protein
MWQMLQSLFNKVTGMFQITNHLALKLTLIIAISICESNHKSCG